MNTAALLTAETLIGLREPLEVMAQLRAHYGEHGTISGVDSAWSVAFDIGKAHAHMRDGGVVFTVEAEDDASLALLQWSVAEHVLEYAPGERPDIVWDGGTKAGRPLPYFREMEVVHARYVTPAMRRVTLSGRDLSRFARDGHHVRLLLPARPGDRTVWPIMASDGRQAWPHEGERPVARVYTIRRIDVAAGEVDIDFVLHEGDDMPGARFGREAVPGDRIGMTGPGGSALKKADRYIFLGDETAIPAIARMVGELPSGTQATLIIEIADPAERQPIAASDGVDIFWLSREGAPAGSTDLLAEAAEAALGAAEDDVFVWGACEHGAARKIRQMLKARGLAKDRFRMAAYWRRGMAGDIDD
jgi:NADPH-dependent ferric siderophore reductase